MSKHDKCGEHDARSESRAIISNAVWWQNVEGRGYKFSPDSEFFIRAPGIADIVFPFGPVKYATHVISMKIGLQFVINSGIWLFCVEQSLLDPARVLHLVGFYNGKHYTFKSTIEDGSGLENRFALLVWDTILSECFPFRLPNGVLTDGVVYGFRGQRKAVLED